MRLPGNRDLIMLECRWMKNLSNFATSRPPFVIFTLCLAIFAAGLFSIGYYVQSEGFEQTNDWKVFTRHISNIKFCMFSNDSNINFNVTNVTSTSSSLDYTQVFLPVLLKFSPSTLYPGSVRNISHVTTLVKGSELGLEGVLLSHQVNLTFLLDKPWSMDCSSLKCSVSVFKACVAATLPVRMVPKHLLHGLSCNNTEAVNMVSMSSLTQCTGYHCCHEGVVAEPSLPKYYKENRAEHPSDMGLDDWATVNLRLQYSSYFLFVLAITCILYGMIKGRPIKASKKGCPGQSI